MSTQKQIPAESAIHYPLGENLPQIGESIEVAPGVRWLRMRLPFALDHINLWLLRDEIDGIAGWTIVDCGIANDETMGADLQKPIRWLASASSFGDAHASRPHWLISVAM